MNPKSEPPIIEQGILELSATNFAYDWILGKDVYERKEGLTFQTRVKLQRGAISRIGWFRTADSPYIKTGYINKPGYFVHMIHGLSLKPNNKPIIYEDGSIRASSEVFGDVLREDTWYDIKIVLNDQGASYYIDMLDKGWQKIDCPKCSAITASSLVPGINSQYKTRYIDNWIVTPVDCPIECTDTDGGKNYYMYGEVKTTEPEKYPPTMMDSCDTNQRVVENYCLGTEKKLITYDCPDGCLNGACIALECEEIGTLKHGEKQTYVVDNVDYETEAVYVGANSQGNMAAKFRINGYVTDAMEVGTNHVLPDGRTIKVLQIIETSKDINSVVFCFEGGACIATTEICDDAIDNDCDGLTDCDDSDCAADVNCQVPTCTDSDGGKDYYVKGVVNYTVPGVGKILYNGDHCNGDVLQEAFCNGIISSSEMYECPNGCQDGACIKEECANEGEKIYNISSDFGPTECCSKNAGIKPSSVLVEGECLQPKDRSKGICIDNWWNTCGDGICSKDENKCTCSEDCPEPKYYRADWDCYDGFNLIVTSQTPLTEPEWTDYAENFCEGHCNNILDICGVAGINFLDPVYPPAPVSGGSGGGGSGTS